MNSKGYVWVVETRQNSKWVFSGSYAIKQSQKDAKRLVDVILEREDKKKSDVRIVKYERNPQVMK